MTDTPKKKRKKRGGKKKKAPGQLTGICVGAAWTLVDDLWTEPSLDDDETLVPYLAKLIEDVATSWATKEVEVYKASLGALVVAK